MSTLKEKIAVMQAFADGKEIQSYDLIDDDGLGWRDLDRKSGPAWNWGLYDYRVKPREPRRFFVRLEKNGSVHYAYEPGNSNTEELSRGKYDVIEVVEVIK
jgi:hypothetical protein